MPYLQQQAIAVLSAIQGLLRTYTARAKSYPFRRGKTDGRARKTILLATEK